MPTSSGEIPIETDIGLRRFSTATYRRVTEIRITETYCTVTELQIVFVGTFSNFYSLRTSTGKIYMETNNYDNGFLHKRTAQLPNFELYLLNLWSFFSLPKNTYGIYMEIENLVRSISTEA